MSNTTDIVVKRIVNAPIDVLWEIWTDAEQITKWYGPKGFGPARCEIDLKVGGKILLGMKAPEFMGGQESFTVGEFTEIVQHERLVFTQGMCDSDGNPIDPADVGVPDFPKVVNTIVEFKQLTEEFTQVVVTQQGFPATQLSTMAYAGWHQSLDKLDQAVASA